MTPDCDRRSHPREQTSFGTSASKNTHSHRRRMNRGVEYDTGEPFVDPAGPVLAPVAVPDPPQPRQPQGSQRTPGNDRRPDPQRPAATPKPCTVSAVITPAAATTRWDMVPSDSSPRKSASPPTTSSETARTVKFSRPSDHSPERWDE